MGPKSEIDWSWQAVSFGYKNPKCPNVHGVELTLREADRLLRLLKSAIDPQQEEGLQQLQRTLEMLVEWGRNPRVAIE